MSGAHACDTQHHIAEGVPANSVGGVADYDPLLRRRRRRRAGDKHVADYSTHRGDTNQFADAVDRAAVLAFECDDEAAMRTLGAHGLAMMANHHDDIRVLLVRAIRAAANDEHERAAELLNSVLTLKIYRALAVIATAAQEQEDQEQED